MGKKILKIQEQDQQLSGRTADLTVIEKSQNNDKTLKHQKSLKLLFLNIEEESPRIS